MPGMFLWQAVPADDESIGDDAVPALPPILPVVNPGSGYEAAPVPPAEPRPWGFWATAGLGAVIALCHIGSQASVVLGGSALGVFRFHSEEALKTNGWVLGVVTMVCAPVLVA